MESSDKPPQRATATATGKNSNMAKRISLVEAKPKTPAVARRGHCQLGSTRWEPERENKRTLCRFGETEYRAKEDEEGGQDEGDGELAREGRGAGLVGSVSDDREDDEEGEEGSRLRVQRGVQSVRQSKLEGRGQARAHLDGQTGEEDIVRLGGGDLGGLPPAHVGRLANANECSSGDLDDGANDVRPDKDGDEDARGEGEQAVADAVGQTTDGEGEGEVLR